MLAEDLNFSLKREIEERATKLDKNYFVKIDHTSYKFIESIVIDRQDFETRFRMDAPSWIQLVNKDTFEPLSQEEMNGNDEVAIAFSEEQLKIIAARDFVSLIAFDSPFSNHFMRVASAWYALAIRNASKPEKELWLDFYKTISDYLAKCISKVESMSDAEWNSVVKRQ